MMSMGSRCQQGFHPILRQQPMSALGVTMCVYTSCCCVSEPVFTAFAPRALGASSRADACFSFPPLFFFLLALSPLQNFLEGAQRPRPPEDGAPVVIIWQRCSPASGGNSQLSAVLLRAKPTGVQCIYFREESGRALERSGRHAPEPTCPSLPAVSSSG